MLSKLSILITFKNIWIIHLYYVIFNRTFTSKTYLNKHQKKNIGIGLNTLFDITPQSYNF
jgi:hypothetical protein